jgi:hypothetical protein
MKIKKKVIFTILSFAFTHLCYTNENNINEKKFTQQQVTNNQYLISAEWFIDTDPGEGNGYPIELPDDGVWDNMIESITIQSNDTNTIPTGIHTVYIRFKDNSGNWGLSNHCFVEIAKPLIIRAAEWVIDPETPPGDGNPMYAVDGAFDSAEEELISDELNSSDFAPDTTIYVRVQDDLNFNVEHNNPPNALVRGRWSSWNGWREQAQIVVNSSVQPTPTPTPPQQIDPTPTPTPMPSDPNTILFSAQLVSRLESALPTLADCGWMEIPGGFEGRSPGTVTPDEVIDSALIPSSEDQRGLKFDMSGSTVSMVMATESIACEGDAVLIRAYVRSEGPNAQIVVGALKGQFSTAENVDGSLGINQVRTSKSFMNEEGVISILFKPDEGGYITPFLQVSTDGLFAETVFVDRVEIYLMKE